mmetsp:Transcript_10391/g.24971  ORF Transcript_10391/g.24971 Transcript_10391/m.24971 type:complete len:1362 (+) Transcript_10391:403-4488(+)
MSATARQGRSHSIRADCINGAADFIDDDDYDDDQDLTQSSSNYWDEVELEQRPPAIQEVVPEEEEEEEEEDDDDDDSFDSDDEDALYNSDDDDDDDYSGSTSSDDDDEYYSDMLNAFYGDKGQPSDAGALIAAVGMVMEQAPKSTATTTTTENSKDDENAKNDESLNNSATELMDGVVEVDLFDDNDVPTDDDEDDEGQKEDNGENDKAATGEAKSDKKSKKKDSKKKKKTSKSKKESSKKKKKSSKEEEDPSKSLDAALQGVASHDESKEEKKKSKKKKRSSQSVASKKSTKSSKSKKSTKSASSSKKSKNSGPQKRVLLRSNSSGSVISHMTMSSIWEEKDGGNENNDDIEKGSHSKSKKKKSSDHKSVASSKSHRSSKSSKSTSSKHKSMPKKASKRPDTVVICEEPETEALQESREDVSSIGDDEQLLQDVFHVSEDADQTLNSGSHHKSSRKKSRHKSSSSVVSSKSHKSKSSKSSSSKKKKKSSEKHSESKRSAMVIEDVEEGQCSHDEMDNEQGHPPQHSDAAAVESDANDHERSGLKSLKEDPLEGNADLEQDKHNVELMDNESAHGDSMAEAPNDPETQAAASTSDGAPRIESEDSSASDNDNEREYCVQSKAMAAEAANEAEEEIKEEPRTTDDRVREDTVRHESMSSANVNQSAVSSESSSASIRKHGKGSLDGSTLTATTAISMESHENDEKTADPAPPEASSGLVPPDNRDEEDIGDNLDDAVDSDGPPCIEPEEDEDWQAHEVVIPEGSPSSLVAANLLLEEAKRMVETGEDEDGGMDQSVQAESSQSVSEVFIPEGVSSSLEAAKLLLKERMAKEFKHDKEDNAVHVEQEQSVSSDQRTSDGEEVAINPPTNEMSEEHEDKYSGSESNDATDSEHDGELEEYVPKDENEIWLPDHITNSQEAAQYIMEQQARLQTSEQPISESESESDFYEEARGPDEIVVDANEIWLPEEVSNTRQAARMLLGLSEQDAEEIPTATEENTQNTQSESLSNASPERQPDPDSSIDGNEETQNDSEDDISNTEEDEDYDSSDDDDDWLPSNMSNPLEVAEALLSREDEKLRRIASREPSPQTNRHARDENEVSSTENKRTAAAEIRAADKSDNSQTNSEDEEESAVDDIDARAMELIEERKQGRFPLREISTDPSMRSITSALTSMPIGTDDRQSIAHEDITDEDDDLSESNGTDERRSFPPSRSMRSDRREEKEEEAPAPAELAPTVRYHNVVRSLGLLAMNMNKTALLAVPAKGRGINAVLEQERREERMSFYSKMEPQMTELHEVTRMLKKQVISVATEMAKNQHNQELLDSLEDERISLLTSIENLQTMEIELRAVLDDIEADPTMLDVPRLH